MANRALTNGALTNGLTVPDKAWLRHGLVPNQEIVRMPVPEESRRFPHERFHMDNFDCSAARHN